MTQFAFDDFFRQFPGLENVNSSHFSLKPDTTNEYVQWIRSLAKKGKYACFKESTRLEIDIKTDTNPAVRAAAVDVLAILGEDAPTEIFLHALHDSDWDVRAAAAQALGVAGRDVPTELLAQALLSEKDESVAEALIRTLGARKQAIELIKLFLRENDSWVIKVAAVWALGVQGENAPVQMLIDALYDKDEMVREAAARALGKVRDQSAVPYLQRALKDSDEVVQEAAWMALLQLKEHVIEPAQPERAGLQPAEKTERSDVQSDLNAVFDNLSQEHLWKGAARNKALFCAITEVIEERNGFLQRMETRPTDEGQTLLIICGYQRAGEEDIIQRLESKTKVRIAEADSAEVDEVIQTALTLSREAAEKDPCEELLIMSFTISYIEEISRQKHQMRVVITGLGYSQIKRGDQAGLNQIFSTLTQKIEDSIPWQQPHNPEDLKMWYHPPDENLILRIA